MVKLFLVSLCFCGVCACAKENPVAKEDISSFDCKWNIPKYLKKYQQTEKVIEYFGFDEKSNLKKIILEKESLSDFNNTNELDNYNMIFEYTVGDFDKYRLSVIDSSHNSLVLDSSIITYKNSKIVISFTGFTSEESDQLINSCQTR